jgi:hypothetical protein
LWVFIFWVLFFVVVMESWEDELERSLGIGLGFEEDMEEEFENDLFL